MYKTHTLLEKVNLLVRLLLPILITQCGMYAMSFADTVMSGHASPSDLAGVAIGSNVWMPVFTGLSGILMGLTPIVSHLIGAKQKEHISDKLMQGLYLSIIIAIILFLAGSGVVKPLLNHMNLTPQVHDIAYHYLIALAFGMLPLFAYNVLRSFIDAHGMTRLSMMITLLALPINVCFNFLLIFGKLGFPKLGGVGAGVATALTYWVIMLVALVCLMRVSAFRHYHLFRHWPKISIKAWKELLKIGLPIGFSIFFETSIFAVFTLLMSQYSTIIVAAHQAAINFASFLYMMPMSVSMALTIAIGFEAGGKRFADAKVYSYLGISIAVVFSLLFALALVFFNEPIARLYSTNPSVLKWTSHFLLFAIFFQISDAIQAPIQGSLRGYKDVNVPFIVTLIAYWVIGLPIGILLAHFTNLGPYGYWIGLISGLAVGACTLFVRLLVVQRGISIKRGQTQV